MGKDILYPLRRLHGWLHEYHAYRRGRAELKRTLVRSIKEKMRQQPDAFFLVMTPEHGNLGDHAIASAEEELLKNAGLSYIEITGKQMKALKRHNLLGLMNGSPVLITGGGNLGTLWMDVELTQRSLIHANPKSPIIIFPNTIFYEKDEWGRAELEKSVKIYNQHKHLIVYAREKASYEFMKPIYKDVRLMPDMVMSLKPDVAEGQRHGCLLCLRGDREKTRTQEQEQEIHRQAAELFGSDVADTDMLTQGDISVEERKNALENKFTEFSKAKLVITDRLHGMVFCAITGTPCVVVDSKSPKVRGCYEWIRHLEYIQFADDVSRIADEYRKISDVEHEYDNSHLLHYYDKLIEVVKEYAPNKRYRSGL